MHIVFAASECVPFAKTGGLADVVGSLPPELAKLGHQLTVFLPRYKQAKLPPDAKTVIPSLTVPFDDKYRFCSVVDGGSHSGVQFYFIDYPPFFDREALYGTSLGDYRDNAERFALYCRAVLEASKIIGVPDIFHCHDWQAALIPILLRSVYDEDPVFQKAVSVFTIHNMGYQGVFPADTLPLLFLPWDLLTIGKLEFYGKVNFLKGAIVFADYVTTVSRKYAQEIQTAEYGFGLEGVLKARTSTVTGILNGVDYGEWNPESDQRIVANYSIDNMTGKEACRADLLQQFGINQGDKKVPVIGIVSRFASQKGFDLISQVADRFASEEMILTVLGTGDKDYEDLLRRLNRMFPQKIAVKIAYDNTLAHKVEAGADMFLMPSHYEPCGLNQIYSMRYGTVPIVRATGGLDDTVEQWDPRTGKGTGFKFAEYSGDAMMGAIHNAIVAYKDQESWKKLVRNGMSREFSWRQSAREYLKVYDRALQAKTPVAV
ncbi:MAG TPA: glycogen synthase GlgA [Terriglobales bacterium]|jgi:starch synthase|nr:glycogen synthase GlgA [Terriglobales bacterium]